MSKLFVSNRASLVLADYISVAVTVTLSVFTYEAKPVWANNFKLLVLFLSRLLSNLNVDSRSFVNLHLVLLFAERGVMGNPQAGNFIRLN